MFYYWLNVKGEADAENLLGDILWVHGRGVCSLWVIAVEFQGAIRIGTRWK